MSTLDAALKLAGRGFHIFPVHNPHGEGGCSCGDPKCSRPGKHPRVNDWPNNATTDPGQLKKWWKTWVHPNVGIVTGQKSGVFVLDIDGPVGERSLSELESKHGAMQATLTAVTGRGQHRYFKYPDALIKCSAGKLAKGLDIRGEGGFVISPPSVHSNGKSYQWMDEHTPIVDAPTWLLDLLTVEDVADIAPEDCIPEGQRNDRMHKEICSLFKTGLSKANVLQSALLFNSQKCKPPLPEMEVEGIVERVALSHNPTSSTDNLKSKKTHLRWFQFDATELLSDMSYQTLSDTQLGWRIRLLAYAWLNHGKLPNDPDELVRLAHASSKARFKKEWRDALFDFEQGEYKGQPLLVNRRMEAEYAYTQGIYEKRKLAGKARQKKQEDGYLTTQATEVAA